MPKKLGQIGYLPVPIYVQNASKTTAQKFEVLATEIAASSKKVRKTFPDTATFGHVSSSYEVHNLLCL